MLKRFFPEIMLTGNPKENASRVPGGEDSAEATIASQHSCKQTGMTKLPPPPKGSKTCGSSEASPP